MCASNVKTLLFVVSGPSGAGKKTLIDYVTARFTNIERVSTYTTRAPRPGETPNVDYFFIDKPEFEQLTESGEIFEYTKTYGDSLYGSPKRLIDGSDCKDIITELDYKGMFRIRASSNRSVISIFILPPSLNTLVERIESRSQIDNLERRLDLVSEQLQFAWAYDYILINEDKDHFLEEAESIIRAELLRRKGVTELLRQRHLYDVTLMEPTK